MDTHNKPTNKPKHVHFQRQKNSYRTLPPLEKKDPEKEKEEENVDQLKKIFGLK